MAQLQYVEGLNVVARNLKLFADQTLPRKMARGLKKAGGYLQRASQRIVPKDEGNLHDTAFTRAEGSGLDVVVTVGYTAEYAVYVHEIPPPSSLRQYVVRDRARSQAWHAMGAGAATRSRTAAHGEAFNEKHAKEIARGAEHSRKPGQAWKFLETPMRTERAEMIRIVWMEAAI